jgi:hypothetical protein
VRWKIKGAYTIGSYELTQYDLSKDNASKETELLQLLQILAVLIHEDD